MKTFFDSELILSSPWHIILLLVVMTALFHIPFYFGKNLTKIGWKQVDYFWLAIATLGLVSITADARSYVAGNWMEAERVRASTMFSIVNRFANNESKKLHELANLDGQVVEHYNLAYEWFNEADFMLSKLNPEDVPELNLKNYPQVASNPMVDDIFKQFTDLTNMYAEDRNMFSRTSDVVGKNIFESILLYFSPFLICFALALRITKVTGEIKLETKI